MKNFTKSFILLLTASSLSGCMAGLTGQDVQPDIDRQNMMIERLSEQVQSMQPAQADTYMQLQTMSQEIAMLRGKVDDLEYRLQNVDLSTMQNKIVEHDNALRAAETQLGVELQLKGEAMQSPSTSSNASGRSSAATTATTGAAATASAATSLTGQALSALDDAKTIDPTKGAQLPTVVTTGAGSKKGNEADTAQLLYDSGISSFNERKYKNALKAFTDFEKVYKEHSLTSNAIFWQGECHYQMQNYPAAALAYEKVISTYPNGNKAPAAYLKQGMTFSLLDRKDAAKERYSQLIEIYPKAPEATRAKNYLENLNKDAKK